MVQDCMRMADGTMRRRYLHHELAIQSMLLPLTFPVSLDISIIPFQ